MKDRITIEGRDGAFGAYIARPKALPAPAVLVLHEVFGVNADIRVGHPGSFSAVAVANVRGELNLAGNTGSVVWHTIRHANGVS